MTSKTRLDELKTWIQSQGWRWQPGKPVQYGEQIVVTDGRNQALVNFYFKRGSLVPGGTDSPLRGALTAWINGEPSPSTSLPSGDSPSPATTRLDALKQFIRDQSWNWGPGADIPYGEQIVVSDSSAMALVNFWPKRGKMDVQGADSPLKTALQMWVNEEQSVTEGHSTPITGPHIGGPHVGMDESGKGDWFGPLVVAAAYVNEQTAAALRRVGVRDSKELDSASIQRIAAQIERVVPPNHRHVWAVEPDTYNRLYAEHHNINLLLADAYAQVAEKVWPLVQAQAIVCDQFSQRADRLESAFTARGLPCPVQQHHAESASIAVAAASILASAAFGEALAQLGRMAGLGAPLPRGASDVEVLDAAARRILETQGPEALGRYAKLNFKPIQALLGKGATAAAIPRPGVQPRPGPPVTIRHETWEVQYHPSGFWRFRFADGGILDWYEDTTGKLDVRGKASAHSYRILVEKANGKVWRGDLEALKRSVNNHIPRVSEVSIPSILGVGWRRTDTVLGARFDFTDGGVLDYYRGKDTLLIQGTPSVLTQAALGGLSSPFWAGLEELTDTLKRLFPDWRLGEQPRSDEAEMTAAENWVPLDGAVDWQTLWPKELDLRPAANKKSPCQRAMLEDWASVLRHHHDKRHLLAHAPTGLGKTLAALAPALAWVAEAPDRRRVYYLANRIAQHENPLRELRGSLAAQFEAQTGQPLRVVDLVSRDLLCDHPQACPLPQSCKDARDAARFDLLPGNVGSWREVKERLAGRVCPYHTLQGLMAQAHVVIADYWWLFSPWAQETGITEQAGFSPTDSILIVDEAHNLAARVRSYLDVDETAARVTESVKKVSPGVRRCPTPVVDAVSKSVPEAGVSPSVLLRLAGGVKAAQAALAAIANDRPGDVGLSIPERILRLLLQPDEAVVIYRTEDFVTGEPRLVFRWVDPTPVTQAGYVRVYASLSMSGTLAAPTDNDAELRYQAPLLGLPERATLTCKYASPFPLRNQRWIYNTDTYGTYKERGNYLTDYARYIVHVGQATPGVTAVFFSSYAFLEQVRTSVADPGEQALIVVEKRADAEDSDAPSNLGEYEQRLRTLVDQHGRAYLFAVYQGKLSEGADFQGNLLKSVICVSIPMEYPSLFHQRLAAQYTAHFAAIAEDLGDDVQAKSREYALDRLSLSWVLQACGRGIRSESDRCAFVLLDKRYHEYGWRRFLEPRPYNLRRPEQAVAGFYGAREATVNDRWDEALVQVAQDNSVEPSG